MERVEFSGVGGWWVSRSYARCLILSGKEHVPHVVHIWGECSTTILNKGVSITQVRSTDCKIALQLLTERDLLIIINE